MLKKRRLDVFQSSWFGEKRQAVAKDSIGELFWVHVAKRQGKRVGGSCNHILPRPCVAFQGFTHE